MRLEIRGRKGRASGELYELIEKDGLRMRRNANDVERSRNWYEMEMSTS